MASYDNQRMQCTSMAFRMGKQVWMISCKCLGEVVAYIYAKVWGKGMMQEVSNLHRIQ
jgi:hypothetical protein